MTYRSIHPPIIPIKTLTQIQKITNNFRGLKVTVGPDLK